MMKIGVMGGTFDPVHLAHIAVAEQAREDLKLDEVLFVPAGQPYFKDLNRITPVEDRLRMVELAIDGKKYFRISPVEIERIGHSYTVDTLEYLKLEKYPLDELFLILGWDSLLNLHLWKKPKKLLGLCTIVAAPRPEYPRPNLKDLEKNLPGISARAVVMDKPLMDISSTDIRDRVKQGLPIDNMVHPKVAAYIREKGLYRQ